MFRIHRAAQADVGSIPLRSPRSRVMPALFSRDNANKSKRHLIYWNSLLMVEANEEHRMAQANT